MTERILIKKLTFTGEESLQDWERIISEAIDPIFNQKAAFNIPNEFTGIIHVTIEYIPSDKEK